jgi:hypothetical protein
MELVFGSRDVLRDLGLSQVWYWDMTEQSLLQSEELSEEEDADI